MPAPPPIPTPEQRLRTMLRIAGIAEKSAYPVKQVARLLDVSNETIYRMIAYGQLGSIRLGAPDRRGRYREMHRPCKIRVDWQSLVNLIEESDE